MHVPCSKFHNSFDSTPFYFNFKEYLQQAQDLVENESILLQTLGKRQVEAPVSVFASCIPHGHCLGNAGLGAKRFVVWEVL